jgi:hypothetical protein
MKMVDTVQEKIDDSACIYLPQSLWFIHEGT